MFECIYKDSVSWLYSCDKSSYIGSAYSQCHVDLLKCTEQNVNNQSLTQVSRLYVHVSFCLEIIRSWLNLPTGGYGHVICMCDLDMMERSTTLDRFMLQIWVLSLVQPIRSAHCYISEFGGRLVVTAVTRVIFSTLFFPKLFHQQNNSLAATWNHIWRFYLTFT